MIIVILIISALVWIVCWWRVYAYNQKKGTRKFVSHFLGFAVGFFPGYFCLHSTAITFLSSPNGIEPSIGDLVTVWTICILTIIGVFYMTSRPIPQQTGPKTLIERLAMHSEHEEDKNVGDSDKDTLKQDEGF